MKGTDNQEFKSPEQRQRDVLADLLRQVAARKRPPAQDEQAIRAAVHDEWRRVIQPLQKRKSTRTRAWAWAMAASLGVVTVLGIQLRTPAVPAPDAPMVASVDKISGTVMIRSAAGSSLVAANPKQDLNLGQTVSTGSGSRMAIIWTNGASIRLDEFSKISFSSINEIVLHSGQIYLDTAAIHDQDNPIALKTAQGTVQHLGTQYMTRVAAGGTTVSVREGQVRFLTLNKGADQNNFASAGELLEVSTAGHIERNTVATWGPVWDWTEALAPRFKSDGKSLAELFDWVSRESGRRLDYTSMAARDLAAATLLRGNLDMEPLRALSMAAATSDLRTHVDGGRIVISFSGKP